MTAHVITAIASIARLVRAGDVVAEAITQPPLAESIAGQLRAAMVR